jgi:hypothetical protein
MHLDAVISQSKHIAVQDVPKTADEENVPEDGRKPLIACSHRVRAGLFVLVC